MKSKIIFESTKSNYVDYNSTDVEVIQTTYVLDTGDGLVTVDKVESVNEFEETLFIYNIYQHCVQIRSLKELDIEPIIDRLEVADPTIDNAIDFEVIKYKLVELK